MGKSKEPTKRPKQNATSVKRSRTQNSAKRERRRPILRTIKYVAVAAGATVLFVIGAGTGYAASMLKDLPAISPTTFIEASAASTVYDRNGQVIGQITSDGDRSPISSISQVSPNLVNAFVAAEDKTFYSNIGINPLSMLRATVQDVIGHRYVSGASTITQETVKLAVFPKQQRTMHRKIQEIALALELNHFLTKDEIMTDYMNWVYMGRMGNQNVYGVKTASEILFHKSPTQLNIPESSFLASIVNNPSYFSPYQFPKNTLARQHYVLNQMLDNHMITQSQFSAAMSYNVVKDIQVAPNSAYGKYPYLMLLNIEPTIYKDLVQAGVYENVQEAEAAVPTAGLKVYTTIDLKMQNDVDNVLSNTSLFAGTDIPNPSDPKHPYLYEAGATLIDNTTGGILAIGGGRNYAEDSYDHSDLPRQPGSSIKPLLDYGPAIDTKAITAGTVFDDAPVTFPSYPTPYSPRDDDAFAGLVTAREALTQSMNVPAVSILNQITPQVGFSYLAKMGLSTSAKTLLGQPTIIPQDENLASAIGGLTNGVTVQQMTSAYSTFANQGIWHQSYLISKITDQNGGPLFTVKPTVQEVYSPQTAYILTNMMHDVVTKGTAADIGARFPGYQISGKTGTTDNLTDGWFVGYTQKYTMGIWMGYNNHQSIAPAIYNMKFSLWSDMMAPILSESPPTAAWTQPAGIVTRTICDKSGQLATPLCTADNDSYNELFIQGTEPTTYCDVHVQADYVIIKGKKYLATTNTPKSEVHFGTFLRPPFSVPNVTVGDSWEYLPTQLDPRGGTALNPGDTNPAGLISSFSSPKNLAAIVNPDGSVTLSWDPVSGASNYMVWRSTSANGPYASIGNSVTGTTLTDVSVPTNQTTIYYEVYAVSNSAMSPPSTPVTVELNANGVPGTGNDSQNGTGNGSTNDMTGNGMDMGSNSTGGNNVSMPNGNNSTGDNSIPDNSSGANTGTEGDGNVMNQAASKSDGNHSPHGHSGQQKNSWLPGISDH